jgi:putative flavoprotein involved in K+ transport
LRRIGEEEVSEQSAVVVIGAGQAGLAVSHELTKAGVEHLVLERGRIGETWRRRWESFCLVTPNWSVRLPGYGYDGDDPDGFMPRDEIVAYLERYATTFKAPVRGGVEVTSLEHAAAHAGYLVSTSAGDLKARVVVVATGAYQKPHRPSAAASLPPGLPQIDIEDYRSPEALPTGKVLIVGSGQSGCQTAEELSRSGRDVFLSCGRTPWAPRRLGGHDIFWWGLETGLFDQTLVDLGGSAARSVATIVTTGHDGGHDLHLRTLRRDGVTLLGHFLGTQGNRAYFAPDLAQSVAWSDDRYRGLVGLVRRLCRRRGWPVPEIEDPSPFDGDAPTDLDLSQMGVVIFCAGFRPDYTRWVRIPEAFDQEGFPLQRDGASLAAPRLYFLGVHFLRTRKSSLLCGVGEDAQVVAEQIAAERE